MVELLWLRRTVRAEKPQAVEGLVFDVDRLDFVGGEVPGYPKQAVLKVDVW